MRRWLALLLFLLPASGSGVGTESVKPHTRPDQVLVVYNRDWVQDLDGSEPGQDSEEIARYYVARRTDPVTGRKPWLLGLSAGEGGTSPLNEPLLKEASGDNDTGLVFRDGSGAPKDLVPKSSTLGDAIVPFTMIESGRAPPRFAGFVLRPPDLGSSLSGLRLEARGDEGTTASLAEVGSERRQIRPGVSLLPVDGSLFVLVDLLTVEAASGTLRLTANPADGPRVFESRFERPSGLRPTTPFPGRKEARERILESAGTSGPLPRLLTLLDAVSLVDSGTLSGFALGDRDLKRVRPETIRLEAWPDGRPGDRRVLCEAAGERTDAAGAILVLDNGTTLYSSDLSHVIPGTVVVEWSGSRKGKKARWISSRRYYDPATLRISDTGPDGVRDDRACVDLVESPIREFLEQTKTDDGIPLVDHVLYIVVVHGLPKQVRSLCGVRRGAFQTQGGDIGSGSSLVQRLEILSYELPEFAGPPAVIPVLGSDGIRRPVLAHPLRTGLIGPSANPLLHPLAFRREAREAAFREQGVEAVSRRAGPPLTAEVLRGRADGKRLFGVTRIDGFSVEEAKARVDGAIYAGRYLTPELGPSWCGRTHEAQITAKALRARGFEVRSPGETAERALYYFGVFSGGKFYADDIAPGHEEHPVWTKGFLPGSVGYARRSFLRWSLDEPPRQSGRLFEQTLRAGVTVGSGSMGGAHETNVSWPDSFVLTQLLFDGYELGDALLRSTYYLDWTMTFVGDPLYRSCLAETEPDRTAPTVASREDVKTKLVSVGSGTFALRVDAKLANRDPEMAEIRVVCRPVDAPDAPAVEGACSLYTLRPGTWVLPLLPEMTYDVDLILTDPYGNRFSTAESFEAPIRVRTGPAPASKIVKEARLRDWLGKDILRFERGELDEKGEIELQFTVGGGRKGPEVPRIVTLDGRELLDEQGRLSVGGAMALPGGLGQAIEAGNACRLLIRWRREPTTRELWIVARDGTEHLVSSADFLPWDPAFSVADGIAVESGAPVREVIVRSEPVARPREPGVPTVRRLDVEAFREHDGRGK